MFLLKINHLQATAIHKYVGLFGLLLIVLGLLVFSTAQPVEAADPLECSSHEFSIRTTPEGGVTMLAGPEGQQEIPGGTEQLAVVQEGCRGFGGENIYWFSLLDPSEASSEGYTFFQKNGNEYFQIEDLDDLSWGGPGSSSDSVVITYVNDRRDEQTVTVGNFPIARGYLQNGVIVDEDGVGVAPGSDAAEDAAEEELACADYVGIIGWALCPITNILGSTLDFTASVVESLLQVPNVYFEADPNGDPPPIKEAWAIIRNIAFTILVPMTLVMVISTALGFEIFSAYTVKKALPRLIFATIFIALSWDLIVLAITVVNGLGAGIAGIITSPIGGFNNSSLSDLISFGGDKWISAFGLLGLGVAGTAAAIGGYGVIFITLAIFVLTILTVLLLLLLREVLIVSLAIFAPIALLAWVFPANTKLWSLWRGSFVKLLLLYPLIMLLLASGRVVAYVVTEGGSFEGIGFQSTVLVLVAYLGPFVFIPTAFRYVGGVFGNIAGMVNDKEKGLFDRGKKLRGSIMKKNTAETLQGSRFNDGTRFGRSANRFGQLVGAASRTGLGVRPGQWGARLNSGVSSNDKQQIKQVFENEAFAELSGDEELLEAVAGDRGFDNIIENLATIDARRNPNGGRFVNTDGSRNEPMLRDAAARIQRVQEAGSARAVNSAAVIAQAGTSSGYSSPKAMLEAVYEASSGDLQYGTNLLVDTQKSAKSAGKVAAGGAAFGTSVPIFRDVVNNNGTVTDEQNEEMLQSALETNNGGAIVNAKRGEIGTLAPYMLDSVNTALESDDGFSLQREVAKVAGRYDAMASASPENAQIMAERVLGQTLRSAAGRPEFTNPDGTTQTVQQLMEHYRDDDRFVEMRREFQSTAARQAAGGDRPSETSLPDPPYTPGG